MSSGPLLFSPAGNEIACQSGGRVVCWNLQGQIVDDCGREQIAGSDRFAWIPDGSGWLLGWEVMLREPKLVVWKIRGAGVAQFLDQDHFREATDQAMREQVFRFVKVELKQASLPYFVPQDPQVACLPLVTDFGR
jgi:hypothetical protein